MSIPATTRMLARARAVDVLGARTLTTTAARCLAQAPPPPSTSRSSIGTGSSSSSGSSGSSSTSTTSASASSSATTPSTPKPSSVFSPLSPSARPPREHSALTVGLVKMVARLMGYNSVTTKAIRVTSDLYDQCAKQADVQADFWYGACRLPRTYQTWFQITTLYIHLLLARFRAFPTSKLASNYSQELINHFFIDAESRMRERFGVQTARLVKGYMKEMHTQQRGAILSLDEALAVSVRSDLDRERLGDADAVLAAALWRNIWGAGGWGEGVGGVKRKVKGVDRPDEKKKATNSDGKATSTPAELEEEEEGAAELAQDLGILSEHNANTSANHVLHASTNHDDLTPPHDLEFAVSLQRLVMHYRLESSRLATLSDEEIGNGIAAKGNASIAAFSKIS